MDRIFRGDSLKILATLPSDSVDCVVTSPPYNKGFWRQRNFGRRKRDTWNAPNISYGGFDDTLDPTEYEVWQKAVLAELVRVLKPKGSIFYNHKALVYKHRLIYPRWVFDFNVRQQIIWDRGNSPQIEPIRWLPTTEYVFWITKGPLQPKFRGWQGTFKSEVWRIPPRPMKNHPAPFPEVLATECILPTTEHGDLVLDPFLGSGTTAVAAKRHGRHYLGIEFNPSYVRLARQRLRSVCRLCGEE